MKKLEIDTNISGDGPRILANQDRVTEISTSQKGEVTPKLDLKFEDVCENKIPNWYKKYTCTEEENKKWVTWMKKYIKDNLKMTNDRAHIQAAWINMNYGLKVKKQK